tara:strand:- start:1415 stop:1615 length:201 start_codon:yes stop_codon:yes gene_type:complete
LNGSSFQQNNVLLECSLELKVIKMADMVNLAVAYTIMIGLIAAWSWMLSKRLTSLHDRLSLLEEEE